jgi:DNA ligase (NAD+)
VAHQEPGTYVFPSNCPSCQSELFFDGVRLLCRNKKECSAQKTGQILNWIKSVQIDDLSEKRLSLMLEVGLVDKISDLYMLKFEDLLKLPTFKEKLAQKIINNISKSKKIPLEKFLSGLGVPKMGERSWLLLMARYPSLENILELNVEEILEVKGFAQKTAEEIVYGLKSHKEEILLLKDRGVSPYVSELKASHKSQYREKIFVITGKFPLSREDMSTQLRDLGAVVSSSVTKNTFALVIDDLNSNSSKAQKAKELKTQIWTYQDFQEAILRENKT